MATRAPISDRILRILSQIEEATLDVGEAKTMPRECYSDAEWYEFEKEAIYARSWLCLGRTDQVKKPGDYFRIDVGDEPLIVVRDQNDEIRVMSAVCAHRAHIVAEGEGNCGKVLRCPLHYWSYGLDGRLITAPSMTDTIPLDQLKKEAYLPQLKVECWNGFIFANMNPDAAPLRPTLGKLEQEFERYHMDELVSMPPAHFPDNQWNWKGMLENGIEPYHTAYLHMTIHDFAHVRLASFADWDDDDGAIFHPTGFYHLDGGFNATEKALLPVIPTLTEKERKQVLFATIPPNLFMGAMPDYVFWYLIMPTGPETMDLKIGMGYPESTTKLPMFEHLHKANVAGVVTFQDQDAGADESVQRGTRSRFRRPGRYSYQEETLLQQNRWLLKRYREYVQDVMAEEAAGARA
jgi:phenylpropionate dioxygenase-like ring-hydroxylating dioxygenase large terminal subunit